MSVGNLVIIFLQVSAECLLLLILLQSNMLLAACIHTNELICVYKYYESNREARKNVASSGYTWFLETAESGPMLDFLNIDNSGRLQICIECKLYVCMCVDHEERTNSLLWSYLNLSIYAGGGSEEFPFSEDCGRHPACAACTCKRYIQQRILRKYRTLRAFFACTLKVYFTHRRITPKLLKPMMFHHWSSREEPQITHDAQICSVHPKVHTVE